MWAIGRRSAAATSNRPVQAILLAGALVGASAAVYALTSSCSPAEVGRSGEATLEELASSTSTGTSTPPKPPWTSGCTPRTGSHATKAGHVPPTNLVQIGIGGWIGNHSGIKVAEQIDTTVITMFDRRAPRSNRMIYVNDPRMLSSCSTRTSVER